MGLMDYFKKKKADSENLLYKDGKINCPRCAKPMIKKTRQGLTIDKCTGCGGIWLDKGEIYKIVDAMQRENSLNNKDNNKKINNKGGAWF
jgi:Zn-finger nucleic acid-binding protein